MGQKISLEEAKKIISEKISFGLLEVAKKELNRIEGKK